MKRGTTLIEMLIYVGLLGIVTTVVLDLFFLNANAWENSRALRNINDGGKLITERLSQEIRLAKAVNEIGPDYIEFDTFQNPTSSDPSTLRIFLDGTELKMLRDGTSTSSLSGQIVRVTAVDFIQLSSGVSKIVRVEFTIESSQGKFLKEKTYTTAVRLRGGL